MAAMSMPSRRGDDLRSGAVIVEEEGKAAVSTQQRHGIRLVHVDQVRPRRCSGNPQVDYPSYVPTGGGKV